MTTGLPGFKIDNMKRLFLLAGVLFTISTLAIASPIHTVVIPPAGPALTITVPDKKLLLIVNFAHDGAAPGTVQINKGGLTANALTSVPSFTQEMTRNLHVAGLATVTVAPVAGNTLTISYRIVLNTNE